MGVKDSIAPGRILALNVCMPYDTRNRDKLFVVICGEPLLLLKINTSGEQTELGKNLGNFNLN